MFGEISLSVWLLGLVAFGAVLWFLRSQFSAEARLARRRRKNYGHMVSKGKGPMVKLAVRTEQPKD